MTTAWILAPNGRWSARNLVGDAAINGTVKTFQAGTRIPKATAQSSSGLPLNPTTIPLDSKGEANIYWADDTLYYIEVFDVNGSRIYTQDNYPVVSGTNSHTINTFIDQPNLVRNPQLTFWDNGATFSPHTDSLVMDDWYFQRSNSNATVSVARQTFNLGQTDVDANPIYYARYECSDTGAMGETYKRYTQTYKNVQTLSGREVAFSINAKSDTSSTIVITLEQFFGTGGSPSAPVETTVLSIPLTADWQKSQIVITMPSVAGKDLGTNGDDSLKLHINFPLNSLDSIDISNTQLQAGNIATDFVYKSVEQQQQGIEQLVNYSISQTGDFILSLTQAARPGWVLCNDQGIGNSASGAARANDDTQALFAFLYDNINPAFLPLYNGATLVARGANAAADYNANRILLLPKTLSRVIINAGNGETGITSEIYFSTPGSTTSLTFNRNNGLEFLSLRPITINSTGTPPSPLINGGTYYIGAVSTTTCTLATSYANAVNGVYITFTTAGSGFHKMLYSLTSVFAVGQPGGEPGHWQLPTEVGVHQHDFAGSVSSGIIYQEFTTGTGRAIQDDAATLQTAFNGGFSANQFNVTQSLIAVNLFLKL